MRQGNFSEITTPIRNPFTRQPFPGNIIPPSMLSPVSLELLQYYPAPNRSGTANNLQGPSAATDNVDQVLARVDHNIGNKVRLSLRFNWHDSYVGNVFNAAIPVTEVTQPRVNKNWLFGYTHTLTPNLFNDFRIGYHRIDFDTLNYFDVNGLTSAGSDLGIPGFDGDVRYQNAGIPSINVSNFSGLGAGGTNWYQFDTTYQVSNVLAYTRGSHSIRAGFDLRRLATGRRAANDARGLFNFTGDIAGYSVADFMLGLPRTVIPPTDQLQGHVGGWRNGFFINDVWQASRNLTLSLGLRYELNTPCRPTPVRLDAGRDLETIIPASFPAEGSSSTSEPHGHRPAARATYRSAKDRLRAGFGIIQPEPDEHVHVPDQQPSVAAVTTHVGPANPTLSFEHPTGVVGPAGRPDDLADAAPECPQGPGGASTSARARRGMALDLSTSARTPATWIAASSTTRRRRVQERWIPAGPARIIEAGASSRTISWRTTTRSASSSTSG
jgi:hypothetical protein